MTLPFRPMPSVLRGACLAAVLAATPLAAAGAAAQDGASPPSSMRLYGNPSVGALTQSVHIGPGAVYTPAVSVEVMPDPFAAVLVSLAALLLLAVRIGRTRPPVRAAERGRVAAMFRHLALAKRRSCAYVGAPRLRKGPPAHGPRSST